MTRLRRLVMVMLAAAAAAALADQQPDLSTPPEPGPPPALRLPPIHKHSLTNGLRVWMVVHDEVPLAQTNLVIEVGSDADPAGEAGVAAFTAAMLDKGAGTRSAPELAEAIESLGAELSTASSFDAAGVRLSVPVKHFEEALTVMADVALRPTFPQAELERLRQERLTSFVQIRDDPEAIIEVAFPRMVFGPKHRYGTPAIGTEGTVASTTRDQLMTFYRTYVRPENATIIVVGDIMPASALPALQKAFGHWTPDGAARSAPAVVAAPQLTRRQVFLIDKPGAAQSEIRIGWVGVRRSTADYATVRVLNTILGDSFTSRLNANLREEHGYSYGAFSAFDMRRAPGPFYATARVQTDKTADALREFFNELQGIRRKVSAEELEKAKNYVALGFPSEFETIGDLAGQLEDLAIFELPDDTFTTFVDRVRQVTADDVQKAATRYIQPDKMAVVVVGDRNVIERPIRTLNLGPLTLVSLDEIFR
jgi:predicted Zn-dependent peptidase